MDAMTVWELTDSGYVQVAHVVGTQTFHGTSPFPVRLTPAELTG